jgi:hypothetical protein
VGGSPAGSCAVCSSIWWGALECVRRGLWVVEGVGRVGVLCVRCCGCVLFLAWWTVRGVYTCHPCSGADEGK